MDSTIFPILLFLFFFLPETILSNSCPTTSCAPYAYLGVPLKYPFKLETDSPHKHCNDYINLKCDAQRKTMIGLPSFGDFEVKYIDYYEETIVLSDPENCLARRLMTNSSVYPLRALSYQNYIFYTCPRTLLLGYQFHAIECLSNPTDATIALSGYSSAYMEQVFGCKIIVTSMVPTSSNPEYDDSALFFDLTLTWNVSGCKECKESVTGDSQSKRSKILKSPAFIPSTVVLVTLFALACFLRLIKLLPASRRNNATANNIDVNVPQSSTIMPQQTTSDTQPQATTGALDQNSKIYMQYKELVVLYEGGQGTSLPTLPTGVNSCSICLEEYDEYKDRIGYLPQCKHYFHGACIDHWLHKNTTCPVCRTSLSKINNV